MDRVALFKDQIYDIALEKQALSLSPIVDGLKTVGKDIAESGIGKSVLNSGLGTKMAVGAGAGGLMGALKAPQQGQDRLSNAVSGAFGGATMGMMAHGVTSSINKGLANVTPKIPGATGGAIVTPPPTVKPQLPPPSPVMAGTATPTPTMPTGAIDVPFKQAAQHLEELIEKNAGVLGNIFKGTAEAGEEAVKNGSKFSIGDSAKKMYNNTLGGGMIKNTVVGAGIGGALGASQYNPDTDDGSFEHSRLGALATGTMAGAGAGLATGSVFKKMPINKVAEYKEGIYNIGFDKKAANIAANIATTITRGGMDAFNDFKKLDEVTRVAIGSSIGGTLGIMNQLQQNKKKEDLTTGDKFKTVAKSGIEGALMGSAIAGMIGYKPGQFKKDMMESFNKEAK